MALRLTSYGGAGKVTGSNFLVEGSRGKILVDCGMEQGNDACIECMYELFPYDAASIDALVVTHAHLDHVGRIPKLVKEGFKGKIFMTPPTRDLALLILMDSAKIVGEEALKAGREPLYAIEDVEKAFSIVELVEYHEERTVAPGLSVYLRNTGHILGSASVRIKDDDGTTLALTGDIGNSPSPLLPDWEAVPDADALLMESTYGDRLHPEHAERVDHLRQALQRAIARGGTILIPAFSLERTQLMLYEIGKFFAARELPEVPVYLDSPLAIRVTEVYEKWGPTYFKPETEDEMRQHDLFEFPFLHKTPRPEDSAEIIETKDPKIIIAGAGMSHGGRIGQWEARYLPLSSTTIFMVGYQAPGTPGRQIVEGVKSIHLHGTEIKIGAAVEQLEGWSAHADRDELLKFAQAALGGNRTKTIFVGLGEPAAERFLAQRIHDYLGARAAVMEPLVTWEITKNGVSKSSK